MQSWKTTVGGIITSIGLALTAVKDPSWLSIAGTILSAIGALLVGSTARDNDKTSEDVGIKGPMAK